MQTHVIPTTAYPQEDFPTSASAQRRDHTGMPIDAIVAVTELNLSVGAVVRLSLIFVLSQALVGLVAVAVLIAIGVISIG